MTHTAEGQSRAEFEAWRIKRIRSATGRHPSTHTDLELRAIFLGFDHAEGEYTNTHEQHRWEAWQAARASVVPEGWKMVQANEREACGHVLDNPLLVHIEWRDPESDWPWFRLLATRGEWLHLQGADYPDGSGKHCGDCFWVHKSDVQTMRSNVGTQPIRPQP